MSKNIKIFLSFMIILIISLMVIIINKRSFSSEKDNLYKGNFKPYHLLSYDNKLYKFKFYDGRSSGTYIKTITNKDIDAKIYVTSFLEYEDLNKMKLERIKDTYIGRNNNSYHITKKINNSYFNIKIKIEKNLNIKDILKVLDSITYREENINKSYKENNTLKGHLHYKEASLEYELTSFMENASYLDNLLLLEKDGKKILLEFSDKKGKDYLKIDNYYLNYYLDISLIDKIKRSNFKLITP